MAKNTRKNQLECNKEARKKYNKENFKYQSICFKIEEIEAINAYCERMDIPKNTFFREACMEYMSRPIK